MKKKIEFKIVKVMKFTPKTRYSHLLQILHLMIGFEDLILVFYICVLNTTLEVIMKKYSM